MKTIAEQMQELAALGREMAELKEDLRLAISEAGGGTAPGGFRLYPGHVRELGRALADGRAALEGMERETASVFESVKEAANASLAAGLMPEKIPGGLPFSEYAARVLLFEGRFLEWRGYFEQIRAAINDMGVEALRDEPFSSYAAKIRQIKRGRGPEETDMAVKGCVGVMFTDGAEWADSHGRGISAGLRAADDAGAAPVPYSGLEAEGGAALAALGGMAENAGIEEREGPAYEAEGRLYLNGRLSPSEAPLVGFAEYRGVDVSEEASAQGGLAAAESAACRSAEYVRIPAKESAETGRPLETRDAAETGRKQ